MEERQLSLFGAETGFLRRIDINEIDARLAVIAFDGTSWNAEKRGEQVREGFAADMNNIADKFEAACDNEEQREYVTLRYNRIVDKAKSLFTAWLQAHSRCLSAWITGPAKFNTRRAESRNNIADARRDEYTNYVTKAPEYVLKDVKLVLTKAEIESGMSKSDKERLLEKQRFLADMDKDIKASQYTGYIKSNAVKRLQSRLETVWEHQDFDLFNEALDKLKGGTVFSKRHQIWERHANTSWNDIPKPKEYEEIVRLSSVVARKYEGGETTEKIQESFNDIAYVIKSYMNHLKEQRRYRSMREALIFISNVQEETGVVILPADENWFWKYKNYELPLNNMEQGSEERQDGTIYKAEGIEVENNLSDERVRLYFDGKPSGEIISYLKHKAFKWSPYYKAWQRQNTDSAMYAVKEFLQKYFPDALNYKPEEESGEEKPEATPTPEPAKPKKPYEKPEMREAKFKQGDHVTFETSEMDYRGVIKKVEYRKPEGFLYTVHVKDDYGEEDIIVEEDALTLAKPRKPYKKPTMTEKTPLYNIGDVVLFQRGQGGAQFAKKERAVILKAKWYEPKRCYMFDVRTDKGEEEIFATQIVSRGPVFNVGDDAYLADGRHVVIRRWRRIETNEEVDFIYSVVCDNGEVYDMTYESDLQKTGPVLEPVSYTKEQLRNIKDPVLKIGDMFVGFEPRDGYIVGWVVIDAKSEKNGDYYDHFYFVRAIAFGYEKNWQGDFRKLDKMRNHMCRKSGYTMGLNDEDIQYWYYHDATHLDKNYEYLVVKLDGESDFIKQKGNLLLLQNTIAAEKWVNERIKK